MNINRIYKIIQGEGVNQGKAMIMCRLQGCPVACQYCDSIYARDPDLGKEMLTADIINEIDNLNTNIKWVDFSGGEPLLQSEQLGYLISILNSQKYLIEIETSGVMVPPIWWDEVDCWVVDYKVPSSGVKSIAIKEWAKRLGENDSIKFVVQDEGDLDFALKHKVPGTTNILSPVVWDIRYNYGEVTLGKEQIEWMQKVAVFSQDYDFMFSTQLHKIIWGQERQDI